METSVNNKCKAFTSLEQSKKLAEILPLESADMRYLPSISEVPFIWSVKQMVESEAIPCWSLATLLSVLPYPYIEQNYKGKWTCRVEHGNTTYLWEDSNPIDACYEMINKLHELKML